MQWVTMCHCLVMQWGAMTHALNQPFIAMHGSLQAVTHAMVDPCIDPLVLVFFFYVLQISMSISWTVFPHKNKNVTNEISFKRYIGWQNSKA